MEISANIEKVFGNELAKLYCEQISEEELKETASRLYASVSKGAYAYGNYNKSELEKAINKVFVEKLAEIVNELLSTPESKEMLRNEAETIIEEARKAAHEKLVEKISNGFCNNALYSNDLQLISGSIQQAIARLSIR